MTDFALFGDFVLSLDSITKIILLLVLGVYAIYSSILYYHWDSYGTDIKVTTFTLVLYFSITIPLLIVMGVLVLVI